MTDFRDRQIGELSGGQKKRVFLARALAQEGPIILLDEPFTGVDVKTETAIIDLLRELRDAGPPDAGLDPQSRQRARLLRPGRAASTARCWPSAPRPRRFTQANLERAFGGVLRHFQLEGPTLHDDDDRRGVTVLTDDERAGRVLRRSRRQTEPEPAREEERP